MSNMHIISKITPLFLKYKAEKNPTQAIIIMWEIGKILNYYIETTGLKPHTLFRDLYGKSETSTNVQQKSYIAREFQGRCYRVYNMFKNIEEINSNLHGLKSVTAFREAMPFFDNEKYKIDRNWLCQLLTSPKKSNALILNEVKKLQSLLIGKKNPRTQRLADMENKLAVFREFYQYILSLIKIKNFTDASNLFLTETKLTKIQIKELAQNTEQLTLSNIQHASIVFTSPVTVVQNYINTIEEILNPKNIKKLRRFKRLVNSKYVFLLTDMLLALIDENDYLSLTRKLKN